MGQVLGRVPGRGARFFASTGVCEACAWLSAGSIWRPVQRVRLRPSIPRVRLKPSIADRLRACGCTAAQVELHLTRLRLARGAA